MNITIGSPVTSEDFFNRAQLVEDLWHKLQRHSVLLAAPRRVGKSSLLLKSRKIVLGDEVMEAFLDQVETFVPIFIQIMASVVASEANRTKQSVTRELIRQCYEQRALGSEFRICFEDYYERLGRYYSPEEARVARRLLRELAISKDTLLKSTLLGIYQQELGPEADASQFDLLLTWLADDFYVEEVNGNRVQFRSRWMRDWWRTCHATKQ
jgi:AAA+ ATPase superfamily predicted ATPase